MIVLRGLLLAAIGVLLAAVPALAQFTNGRAQVCDGRTCSVGYFSAVNIGRDSKGRSIFLTCAHCVAGATRLMLGIEAKWQEITLIGAGRAGQADVAVLAYSGATRKCVPLAASSPGAHERVTIWACPGGNQLATRESSVDSVDGQSLWVQSAFHQGESGGAILKEGQLVGLISATPANPWTGRPTGEGPGRAVPVEAIRSFVQSVLGELPTCACGESTSNAGKPAPQASDCRCGDTSARIAALETALRERTVEWQRTAADSQTLRRELDRSQASIVTLEQKLRDAQLAAQSQVVEVQRVSKEIETIKQMAGRIGFKVRLDQQTGQVSLVPEGQ